MNDKEIIESMNKKYPRLFTQILRRDYPEIMARVDKIDATTTAEKLWLYINHQRPRCYCGNERKFYSFAAGYKTFCSNKCTANAESVRDKRSSSVMEKYGVSHFSQSIAYKEKFKQTCQERYGVDNPGQIPGNKTSRSRKKQETFFNTLLENDDVTPLFDFSEYTHIRDYSLQWECKKCKATFATCPMGGIKCPECSPSAFLGTSKFEQEVASFICELGVHVDKSDRSIIAPKELDIVVPYKKLAIECNGIYWHSEAKCKDKDYHLNKTIAALAAGFQLVHIFQSEWNNQQSIVKSILKQRIIGSTHVLYARKLEVRAVDKKSERQFLTDNHLQGYTSSKVCLGLFDGDVLIQMMSFGKPRFNKKFEWELIRLATKSEYTVCGGANKLFKWFVSNHSPSSIVSYCDRRWFSGEVYHRLGFTLSHASSPNYFYVEPGGTLASRMKYQKHRLLERFPEADPNWTENEIAQWVGLYRIWDSGNLVFHWTSTGQ